MKTRILALLGILLTLFSIAGVASAAVSKPANTAVRCAYWTTNNGVAAVVRTGGINCSKTASFTIWAPPYYGATFVPEGGVSAFNGYLQQIGEYVNGPGNGPNVTGYRLVWSGNNVYTNHQPTFVYAGPHNDGSAGELALLLKTGLPFP